ncbi:MAG: 50S ribosomal protein L28 [Elusimicrobia bacterium]|nr:50S ribosomal protein L28 [Elusimicrobiota bacterium]MBD3412345.1 50S ribosomal protein L28 [Elusimicrobiota bacterium]
MAYQCISCGKKPAAGKSVSHSHRATTRRFMPNLQRIRIKQGNKVLRAYVCTVCLRSGRVKKAG